MEKTQYKMDTMTGALYLVASDQGLEYVSWDKQPMPIVITLDDKNPRHTIINKTRVQIDEYFEGKRTAFDLPLNFSEGTAFQKQVWQALTRIPFGSVISYGELARRIKNDKAVRAVGSANGKNPMCIVVPCHRVIAANGTIGGFSGGLNRKRTLLKHEGIVYKK